MKINLFNKIDITINRFINHYKNDLNIVELFFEAYILLHKKDFNFVQIGANDGVRADPIYKLVKKHNIKGILVEPLPDMYSKLRENYKNCSNLNFENLAIGDIDGFLKLYRFKINTNNNLPDYLHGMATFDKKKLKLLARKYKGVIIEELNVPLMSVLTLIEKYQLNKIDLLVIDVEGMEIKIINQFIECGLLPKIILYEYINLTNNEIIKFEQKLSESGYSLLHLHGDTLAVLK